MKMIDEAAVACIRTGYRAKAKLVKLIAAEDGMETLESVIIIAIAVTVAGLILNFLTRGTFGDSRSDQGLLGYMFERIGEAITDIFDTDINVNPT